MMNEQRHLLLWRLLVALLILGWVPVATAATSPNILLVVLDDAGYSDVKGFGRDDAPTPHLRELAAEGVRFTRHYADSTCRPARLALMTGRESARVAQNPDFRGIPPDLVTLAEALKSGGYSTHHIGKWHLGDSVREAWPDQQGFDSWFGFLNQFQLKGPDAEGQFSKRPTYDNPFLQGDSEPLRQHQGHLEDILTERVVARVHAQARQPGKPWFINWWLFAPHHPSKASADWLAQFPDTPAGRYQALLAQADANIGRVIGALRETGQLDQTLIVVTSDNGGTNDMMNNNDPFAGVKGEFREGSLRTPLVIRWPDRRHANETRDAVVAIQDLYPTILADAGITLPAGLDGQDLHPLLDHRPLQARRLVHEIVMPGQLAFSLLSEDGRWRLVTDSLYDLQSNPAGDRDVATVQANRQQALAAQYLAWRRDKIVIPVTAGLIGQDKVYTGEDFRRAPGYGPWSMAAALHWPPAPGARLMYQPGFWSLTMTADRRLKLAMGPYEVMTAPLDTKAFSDGSCVPLVVTAYFSRSRLHALKNNGQMQLYLGGQQLARQVIDNPIELLEDLTQPTIADKLIQSPRFFNAELLPTETAATWQDLSVEQAGQQVCAAALPAQSSK